MTARAGVREDFVTSRGLRLHYVAWGNPTAPSLFLVHGWDGTARYWDLVAPAFADRFHVVALTLRGRGLSDEDPTGDFSFAGYVDELRDVTRALSLERLMFVGASLGGLIGLPYAAAHPGQVERLVLVDIGAQLGGDQPSSYYAGFLTAPDEFATAHAAEQWLRQWNLYAKLPSEGMAIVLREHFRQSDRGGLTWRFAHKLRAAQQRVAREVLFPSQWHVLRRVTCPVLVVHGTRSESLLPDVAARTVAALSQGTLAEITDCSHFPFLEAPDALVEVLRRFLG